MCGGQQSLRHATELKQHPASTQGTHLHQVVFLRVVIYFIGPLYRAHTPTIQLIKTSEVQPDVLGLHRMRRAVLPEGEFCNVGQHCLPLVRENTVFCMREVGPLTHRETALRNEREDASFSIPEFSENFLAGQASMRRRQEYAQTLRLYQHNAFTAIYVELQREREITNRRKNRRANYCLLTLKKLVSWLDIQHNIIAVVCKPVSDPERCRPWPAFFR